MKHYEKHGKRLLCILLAAVMGASILACNQNKEEDTPPESDAPSSSTVEKPTTPYLSDQEMFYNTLGFSFMPPERMRNGRCFSKTHTNDVMENQDMEYSHVDFIFDDDREHPLLSILVVPMDWWSDISSLGETEYTFLGEQDGTAYVYTAAKASPYEKGGLSDLYTSMIPTADEVTYAFSLQEPTVSTLEATLVDGAMQTILVKTDDGTELSFSKENAEVISENGLLVGQRLKISYTGIINGTNTTGVHLKQIEVLSDESSSSEESTAE